MHTLTIATSNLTNAISSTMTQDGYLVLEVGVSEDGMKTVSANILSGTGCKKITYSSLTGEITDGHHSILSSYKMESVSHAVITAFRELMFAFNTMLNSEALKNTCYQNNLKAFNAIIKPWSVEITHIQDMELVRVARMKDCSSMLISGKDGTDHGSFKVGEPKTALQVAYELLSDSLLLASATKEIASIEGEIRSMAA